MLLYDSVGPNPRLVRMFAAQRGIELLPRLFQTTQTDKFVTIFSTKIGVFGFHRDGPVHKSRSLFMQPAHPRRADHRNQGGACEIGRAHV